MERFRSLEFYLPTLFFQSGSNFISDAKKLFKAFLEKKKDCRQKKDQKTQTDES